MDHRPPSSLRRTIALAILASLAFSILAYYQTFQLTATPATQSNYHDLPLSLFERSSTSNHRYRGPMDEADFIIHRAYDETYARMADCQDNQIEKDCIQKIVDQFKQQRIDYTQQTEPTETDAPTPLPWWFQTLLRDIPTNGAYGFWHHFSTSATNPPIKFCAIGKNGSTEWRKVFKALNAPEFGGVDNSKYNTKKKLDGDTPQTVFLRDPLERLLSAYLDKCAKDFVRKTQGL
jgi:hypothetical protein